jgi:glyoxylase-like metal-dependent hydrolase (beta-lactamase superfamily II)
MREVALVRAANSGPLTLTGTNTWIVGRDPAWVVDPGPDLPDHLDAVAEAVRARGGAGGIAITHDHPDHVAGLAGLQQRLGNLPVAAARGESATHRLADGDAVGPLRALRAPGHSSDHFVFLLEERALFSGDAVLGAGSVFIASDMAGYLDFLRGLRERELEVIHPGHGPVIGDPRAHLDGYIAHRLARERKLLDALDRGLRDEEDLLDAAWDDAPAVLRPAARLTLRAHLAKLAAERRLPG